MKNITDFINEAKQKDVLLYSFEDLVDFTGSSDNTISKGSILIGNEGIKFNFIQPDNRAKEDVRFANAYKEFVAAYKAAGGQIHEEFSQQGNYEVFCNYKGTNLACEYILLSFLRMVYGVY